MIRNKNLIEFYKSIHKEAVYGNTSIKALRFLRPQVTLLKPKTILDYGCGQSVLLDVLNGDNDYLISKYDPAVLAYESRPQGVVDLLLCVDVLEHIPEANLDDVLSDMSSLCKHALIVVDLKESQLCLDDGSNAHVTLKPEFWWDEKISKYFGPLVRFKTIRRSRAAYRTWQLSYFQKIHLFALRVFETIKYYCLRLIGIREGL